MQTRPADQPHLVTAALAALLLLSCLLYWPPLARLDFIWLDFLTAHEAKQTSRQQGDSDIVIIDIDDYSLRTLGDSLGRWPWPRATHAELVEWLEKQGVRAIVFDIWFSERDILRPEFDAYFGEVLDTHRNIFLPTLEMNSTEPGKTPLLAHYPANLPILRNEQADINARTDLLLPVMGTPSQWRLGLVNYTADRDGIARHYQTRKHKQGWTLLSMPQVLANDPAITPTPARALPSPLRLAWHGDGKQSPYRSFSFADIWQAVASGQRDDFFRNRIVFIGSTAAGLHDLRPTPINAQYPALYMLANTYDNLKNSEQLLYAQWFGLMAGSCLLLATGMMLWRKMSLLITTASCTALALALALCSSLLVRWHVLLPIISPIAACLLLLSGGAVTRYLQERAARQAAIDLFGRFLDPLVVKQLASEGLNEQTLAGRQCDISVLFSDIRGFTTLSEKSSPADIMKLLNAYFTKQVGVIFKYRGTLDKFIGDAIMAFWGAPLPNAQHAIEAVNAALDMVDALEHFRREHNLMDFDVGIGIHSGPAVVGMLGCDQRLEYTAIGDTVNLGSRLEGITKGIARILVSQSTRDLCGEQFDFISHGSCKVKGRDEPVNIYEPRRKSA